MNSLMKLLPLVFADPDQVLLYRQQGDDTRPITARQFMADAQALAFDLTAELGVHHPIVNLCQDRYRFMVGFAATILAGKTNLLPSTYTGETLRQIFIDAPDALCLHDHEDWPFPYPHLSWAHRRYRESSGFLGESGQIKPEHVAAQVFTSGSTGLPMPHNKTWGKLVWNVEAAMQQLALASPMSLVGTVPPQHMFGFESLVLLCLIGRCPLWSGKPFYPADIVAALDAMPEPRMLVTTPFHLQALLDAEIALPKIDRLLLSGPSASPARRCLKSTAVRKPVRSLPDDRRNRAPGSCSRASRSPKLTRMKAMNCLSPAAGTSKCRSCCRIAYIWRLMVSFICWGASPIRSTWRASGVRSITSRPRSRPLTA